MKAYITVPGHLVGKERQNLTRVVVPEIPIAYKCAEVYFSHKTDVNLVHDPLDPAGTGAHTWIEAEGGYLDLYEADETEHRIYLDKEDA